MTGSTSTVNVLSLTNTAGSFTGPSTLNVSSDVVLDGGTFSAGASINVAGDFTNNGGAFVPGAGTLTFSPDGKRLAYSVGLPKTTTVVVDGTPHKKYDQAARPVFGKDSKHVAYVAVRENKQFVVIDGREGPDYDEVVVGDPVYQADGTWLYLAVRNKALYRVFQQNP